MRYRVVCLISYCALFIACNGKAQVNSLSAYTFEKQLNTPGVQLLDVRTAGEYRSGYIKNALQADWLKQNEFQERIKHLDKTKPLLVYCASGVRSMDAAKWLYKNGFQQVANLKGGLSAWEMDDKPIVAAQRKPQMTIADFQLAIQNDSVVLVDVGAEWCPPCKIMEPVIQQLEKDLSGKFVLLKVDGGNDIEVMKHLKSEALPTFIVFKKGKETWRKQGIVADSDLRAQVSE